jgi:hypothetical protein
MAFLFKSKKHQSNIPAAARDIHTSDGSSASSRPMANGFSSAQSPTPSSSVNNSLNSLGGGGANSPDQQQQQWAGRSRSESESRGVSDAVCIICFPAIDVLREPSSQSLLVYAN